MNAAETLLASGDADAAALVCANNTITYGSLRERVAGAAGWLRAHGVGPGDRVVLAGADGSAWVTIWLATVWAGGVAVGLNPRLRGDELGAILQEVGARVCFADIDAAASISTVSLYAPLKLMPLEGAEQLSGVRGDPMQRDSGDAAFWIYSSGSTGRPKAIVHAHRAVAACGDFAREVLQAEAQDRFFATSRLFFAYALANSLFAGLRLGATVILDSAWPTPERTTSLVEHYRPTLFFSVPTFYQQLLEHGAAERFAAAGVRRYVSAGEALPAQIAQRWKAASGCALTSGYGMTETLALVLYRDSAAGDAAQCAPGAEVSHDELPIERDRPVRLWFRHPSLALGYHRWPDLQSRNFRGGWCSSGDLFFLREGERWEFAGRDDALIKVAGRWVSTLDLQLELGNDLRADVRELAVVGVLGTDGLTGIALFSVPRPGRESEARECADARIGQLPHYQKPRWQYWLDMLPRSSNGKLEWAQLRRIHAEALGLSGEGQR